MANRGELEERRREFRDFVWNHAADAFQAKFDKCAALTAPEAALLQSLLRQDALQDSKLMEARVRELISKSPYILRRILQVVGLTRNKIIQDIKGFARAEQIDISLSTPEALFNSVRGSKLASEYLAKQLIRVFGHTAQGVSAEALEVANQATWPGYIRQERAKRSGHEAEYRLACLLSDCGLPFEPEEKADNPLCRDVLIDGMSYDLVSPSKGKALLRVVATVHTANIGQYGESKDDLEIRKAIAAIERAGDRRSTTLLAFIDGVGFESNTAGLNGVLENADEFCQFRTIWKAAVIAASKSGRNATVALPPLHHARFASFCSRFSAKLIDPSGRSGSRSGWVEAGDALMKVD